MGAPQVGNDGDLALAAKLYRDRLPARGPDQRAVQEEEGSRHRPIMDETRSMDVFEAMGTARAMRFFQPDAVPDDLVEKVLWAATRASSGNNTQGWDFVVVRDPAVRARLAEALVPFAEAIEAMPDPGNETDRRTLRGCEEPGLDAFRRAR